jgi:hypothetical protein
LIAKRGDAVPQKFFLLPYPQSLTEKEGRAQLSGRRLIALAVPVPNLLFFTARQAQTALAEHANVDWTIIGGAAVPGDEIGLLITLNETRGKPQSYRLTIGDHRIRIEAHDLAGAFYGVQTLIQLLQQFGSNLPALEIDDWFDLPARGVLLDISRDKVPTMTTLYGVVNLLASWKINQLQLYTEHTFAYHNHPLVWTNSSPMTADQILALDAYCRERYVDLVPNQNCFGHMHRWFKHQRYMPLAESPTGFTDPWGNRRNTPFSLDPTNPASLKLIHELFAELLPNFTSHLVNVNCDETFDLGQGRSRGLCEEKGTGRVYLDFLLEIHRYIKSCGLTTMQYWGDIVGHYPALLADLPPGAIALEWGYEADHPFDKKTEAFADAEISFYVCPGTSSWLSLSGRTDNCVENIRNAVRNGLKHGAIGILNTDWGDRGHWQQLPISYLGWAYGAALGWAYERNTDLDLPAVLDRFAFQDQAGVIGKLVYDLGNAYQKLGILIPNSSVLHFAYDIPMDTLSISKLPQPWAERIRKVQRFPSKLRATIDYISDTVFALDRSQMARPDAGLIKEELQLTADMLQHGARRLLGSLDRTINTADLLVEFRAITETYRCLWLARNRPGGLNDSLGRMTDKRPIFT